MNSPLNWTVDGYASTVHGFYHLYVFDDEIGLHYLPVGNATWHHLAIERTIEQAKLSAAKHNSLTDEQRRPYPGQSVVIPFNRPRDPDHDP